MAFSILRALVTNDGIDRLRNKILPWRETGFSIKKAN